MSCSVNKRHGSRHIWARSWPNFLSFFSVQLVYLLVSEGIEISIVG